MKRYKYNINGHFHNVIQHYRLTPTFFYETVPGETWFGNLLVRFMSNATNGLVLNRIFLDHYVFYIPYRLLWDRLIEKCRR